MTALVRPDAALLPAYVRALERGWSPDTQRPQAAAEDRARIARDAGAFLAGMEARDPGPDTVTLPDGSEVPRLPGLTRWITAADGVLVGRISLRWQDGTDALPPHVLGHVGYGVFPWARGRGHATAALGLMRPIARSVGLRRIMLTCDPGNLASIRVIERNGGMLIGTFEKAPHYGGGATLRYEIAL